MGLFSEETLKLPPIPNKDLAKSGVVLYGEDAVKKVEELEGRKLTPAERRVVILEGFVPVPYLDSEGIKTIGVGQTGKFMRLPFKDSFDDHVNKIRRKIKKFDSLPEFLKIELIQSAYRGGITGSPNTLKLINKGQFSDAAIEFLDNAEFKAKKTKAGIKKRMLALSDALASHSTDNDELAVVLPSATQEEDEQTPPTVQLSEPVQEVSTATPTASAPEENAAETSSQTPSDLTPEEQAFIEDYVDNIKGSRQEGLDRAIAAEDKINEDKLAAAAKEAEFKLTSQEEAFINSYANVGVQEFEGEAGRRERLAAEEERREEDARLEQLF